MRSHGRRSIGRVRERVYAAATVLLLAAASCAPPDQPPWLSSRLPGAVVEALAPDTVRSMRLGPGVIYRYLWSDDGPWAVHIVEATLDARCELRLDVLRAQARETGAGGFETVTSMVSRSDRVVLAAVNADFFTPQGTAAGTEVVDGVVRSVGSRPVVAWRGARGLWIGTPSATATTLELGWTVPRTGGDDATEAVGGFPELLAEGERVGDLEVSNLPGFAASRHPRTAVGYAPDTGRMWMVVVDGRQAPYSSGMTLPELAALFQALGAREAINLDGGGSSVLVVRGGAVSRPSDETGERPSVNALALVRDPASCEGARP